MPQITSHRRNLATLFLDPTLDTHLMHQPKSSSAHHRLPPPPPDPIIHTDSEHKSLSATHPHLQPASTVIHSSCTALAKSKSQRGHNFSKQKSSDEIKKTSKKKEPLPGNLQQPMGMGGGGRRRSFCSSQIELGDVFSHNNVKVVSVDMAAFMQIHAVNFARKAYDSLEKFTPKALALTLKKEFDGVYGAAWHCIVGSSFGSFVTHSVGGFIYFSMDHKLHVLLFKTSIKRAS